MKAYLFLPFTIVRLQVSVLTVGLGPTSGEPLWSLPTEEGQLPIGYPHCEVGMGGWWWPQSFWLRLPELK